MGITKAQTRVTINNIQNNSIKISVFNKLN